jgi:GT2 family glycosyltransferase
VQEFVSKHYGVRLLDNPNKTAPYALNIGLQHATGDVIIRVDGHATIEKDYLTQCVDYLQRTGADCVGGVIVSVNETFIGKAIALGMSSPFGVGNARFRTSGKEGFVDCLAFGAYKREVFDRIGNFDEELTRCQDDDFNYRLRQFGGRIFFTPRIRSKYYPRSNLGQVWRQYFGYGLWKIRVLQKHFKRMQPRQFVPPGFVLSLLTTGVLGMFLRDVLWIFLFIALAYIVATVCAALSISRKKGAKYFAILPAVFFTLHTSYGLGFLLGVFRFSKYWQKA